MKERARLFGESLIEGEKLCVRQRPPLLSVVITCFNYETFVKDRPGHDRRYAIDARKLKAGLMGARRKF